MGDAQNKGDSQDVFAAIQEMLKGAGAMAAGPSTGANPVVAPGQVAPGPPPNIAFNPGGSPNPPITTAGPRPITPHMPTGGQSIGNFQNKNAATNAGLVSLGNSLGSMFSEVGKKEHDKKAMMAENYLMQINALLASGNPEDKQKAMTFLEDPKIKKILKTGLEYVPLEEKAPPEAEGVQKAVQKISGQAQAQGQQGNTAPPTPQQQQRMQAVLPQASQQDQLKSAVTSAMIQKIQKDPAAALAMGGVSALSSSEERATQFYTAGLGMSPNQVAAMTQAEKLQGLKLYEGVIRDAMKAQVDLYKADKSYSGKVDAAKVFAASRDRLTDAIKANSSKRGAGLIYASGANVYAKFSQQYMDIVKSGKEPNGQPLTPEHKKMYEQKAQEFQQKADDFLNQQGDEDLWNMFMHSAIDESEKEE